MATLTQLGTLSCVLLVAPTGCCYIHIVIVIYMMKLSFFPVHSLRWLAVGVDNIIPISVCVTIKNTSSCQFDMVNESTTLSNASENGQFHQCWKLRWTNSPPLNLIPMDQLLAFEPFL